MSSFFFHLLNGSTDIVGPGGGRRRAHPFRHITPDSSQGGGRFTVSQLLTPNGGLSRSSRLLLCSYVHACDLQLSLKVDPGEETKSRSEIGSRTISSSCLFAKVDCTSVQWLAN